MTAAMSRDTAETTVRTALRGFAPESYLRAVSEDDSLRATLELDSIDYLTFIERLSAARRPHRGGRLPAAGHHPLLRGLPHRTVGAATAGRPPPSSGDRGAECAGTTYGATLASFSRVSSCSRSGVDAATIPAPARNQARPAR